MSKLWARIRKLFRRKGARNLALSQLEQLKRMQKKAHEHKLTPFPPREFNKNRFDL